MRSSEFEANLSLVASASRLRKPVQLVAPKSSSRLFYVIAIAALVGIALVNLSGCTRTTEEQLAIRKCMAAERANGIQADNGWLYTSCDITVRY